MSKVEDMQDANGGIKEAQLYKMKEKFGKKIKLDTHTHTQVRNFRISIRILEKSLGVTTRDDLRYLKKALE